MEIKEKNEYSNCFRYIIFIMKMLGVFPFFPLHEVSNVSQLLSTVLSIVSVSLYLAVLSIELPPTYTLFVLILREFGYIQFINFIPTAAFCSLILIAPFITWGINQRLRNYRKNWMNFQIGAENITRSPYKCSTKNKIKRAFAIGMICMSIIALLSRTRKWVETRYTVRALDILTGLYITNAAGNMVTYWVVHNMYTKSAAKKIIRLAQQAVTQNRDVDLRRLPNLWTMLCDLNEEFINSHSFLFLFLFSLITITSVGAAFSAIILFISEPDKSLGLTFLIGTVVCWSSLMAFCESANSVTKYMMHELSKTLVGNNAIHKNRKLLLIITSFLQTIETRNPRVTFNGYMTLDRSTVSLILGTSIYFMVVLNQFSSM